VGVSKARGIALISAGLTVPEPLPIRALIDTGASCTCIDPVILQNLNLTPTGSVLIHTPTTGLQATTRNQYDVALMIPNPDGFPFIQLTVAAVECELFVPQGIHALFGRDVLRQCFFTMDGLNDTFTLAY
jgi:hypothetical protein